jgi:hypothetical protein
MPNFPYNFTGPGGSGGATPSAPDKTIGTLLALDDEGNALAGVVISFRLSEPPVGDGNSYSRDEFEVTSDEDGVIEQEFLKNAWYIGRRGQGPEIPIDTGDEDAFDIPNIPTRPEPLR